MAFSSFSEFLNMGGYAFYVWLAYGISLLSVLLLIIDSINKRKKIFSNVSKRLQREQRIQAVKERDRRQ